MKSVSAITLLALLQSAAGFAQTAPATPDGLYFPSAAAQSETDEYTRYELLAPESASFKIDYEVTPPRRARNSSTTRSAKAASPATSMCSTP